MVRTVRTYFFSDNPARDMKNDDHKLDYGHNYEKNYIDKDLSYEFNDYEFRHRPWYTLFNPFWVPKFDSKKNLTDTDKKYYNNKCKKFVLAIINDYYGSPNNIKNIKTETSFGKYVNCYATYEN